MGRTKLARFETIKQRSNVLEIGKPLFENVKGQWSTAVFSNENPITLELACGRGEYTIGLARKFPNQNFVGVDIKGDRIWKGSSQAIEFGLENVCFLRSEIQFLNKFFQPGEIHAIWITFPDPRPKDRDDKRRITHTRYLELYKTVLAHDGWMYLKTDNTGFFEYTIQLLEQRDDIRDLESTYHVYESSLREDCHDITTRYERKFSKLGHDIKFLKFRFIRK